MDDEEYLKKMRKQCVDYISSATYEHGFAVAMAIFYLAEVIRISKTPSTRSE